MVNISDDDCEVAALQASPAPEAATASTLSAAKRRRLCDGSASSGIIRTPDGRPATVIAVTPGGVAIPLADRPNSHAARRDGVISAVRTRGGVVGRNVARRIDRGASAPAIVPAPPQASVVVGQASGSLGPDAAASIASPVGTGPMPVPRRPRSTVRLPSDNVPNNVRLSGAASSSTLGRLVEWFRNVRARRGGFAPSA